VVLGKGGEVGFMIVSMRYVSPFSLMGCLQVFSVALEKWDKGTLLSPLLFVLVIEAFSRMMTATVERDLMSGVLVGSRHLEAMVVSHLLFADNTYLLWAKGGTTFDSVQSSFVR
jgi:hypothetical protein